MASVHYANGGTAPNPTSVGWLDFTGISLAPATTVTIVNSIPGGYTLTLNATNNGTTGNTYNPQFMSGFMTGGYTNVAGGPGYGLSSGATPLGRIDFTNISVTDSSGNPVLSYKIVMGDGETTVNGEFWNLTTNGGPWAWITTLPTNAVVPSSSFVGVGTTLFSEVGSSLNGNAAAVVSTSNATAITFTTNLSFNQFIDVGIVGAFISASKSATPYAAVGNVLTFTIPITNYSDATLTNVVLTDTLPSGTTFVANSLLINGVTTPSQSPPTITLPDMGISQTTTVVFQVLVTTVPSPNPINNQAFVQSSYPGTPTIPTNNSTNITTTTINDASISLTKSVDKTTVLSGGTLTYTVVLQNTGNTTATNVVVQDTLPTSTTFVPGSVTGGTGSPATGITVGNIPPSGVNTVTFQVAVTNPPTSLTLPNTATENHTFVSNNPSIGSTTIANATSNTVTTNVAIIEINSHKAVTPPYGSLGDTLSYTITVTNPGTLLVTDVVLTDTIPPGTTYIANSAQVNGVPATGSPDTGIPLGTLPSSSVTTITFDVLVTSIPPGGVAPNSATTDYSYSINGTTIAASTNTNTVLTTIADATIVSSKAVDKPYAVLGDTLTYTIVLSYAGNTSANNVTITDTLPTGVNFIPNSITINGVPQPGLVPTPPGGANIGNLTTPGVYTLTFQAQVTTLPATNPILNNATVDFTFTSDPSVPNGSIRTDITNTVATTLSFANLSDITKQVDKSYADCGDMLTYTIGIPNTGTTDATNVVFHDTIPLNTTFVTDSVTVNGVPQPGTNPQAGIVIGSIAPGEIATVTFQTVITCTTIPLPI